MFPVPGFWVLGGDSRGARAPCVVGMYTLLASACVSQSELLLRSIVCLSQGIFRPGAGSGGVPDDTVQLILWLSVHNGARATITPAAWRSQQRWYHAGSCQRHARPSGMPLKFKMSLATGQLSSHRVLAPSTLLLAGTGCQSGR